jgi:hypothetical protein
VLQGAALFRQLVFHADRCFRDDESFDNPFRLQLSQPFREHPVTDVRNGRAELREAHPALKEELDNRTGPPAADKLDGTMKPLAELGFEAHSLHFTTKRTT